MIDQSGAHDESVPPPRKASRWRIIIGLLLLLAATGHYLRTGYKPQPIVLFGREPKPIKISPEFQTITELPASRGDLAGYNVLLITMDTTRVDRIGCYGNEEIKTPALDALAKRGVIFSQAIAVTPSTLPSHTSILTGLYPVHHGSRANGLYSLPDSFTTLAESLSKAGYRTGAAVSAYVLDSRFGIAQGFEHYDDDFSDSGSPVMYRYQERKADRTTDRAIQWLSTVSKDRFFLWTHYFDPHSLYEPPSPYAEQYADHPYDGEIAFVDQEIARLLATLEELGVSEKTLVVVVADHGESLGQHGEPTHAFLTYDPTLHIPLVFSCGNQLGKGVRLDRRVSQVDIMPTILSLLGIDAPDQMDGVDLTVPEEEPRYVFAETLHGLLIHGWAALLVAYEGPYKYIHGPSPELYDLLKDPFEGQDLSQTDRKTAAKLKKSLTTLFGPDLDVTEVAPPTESLSISDMNKLRALGYVGGAASIPEPESRPNPLAMMPPMQLLDGIIFRADMVQRVPECIKELENLIKDYPDFHPTWRYLGDLHRLNNDPANAEKAYIQAAKISPDANTLYGLAVSKLYSNKPGEAEVVFRDIISRYPEHFQSRYFLGMILGKRHEYDEASKQFCYIFDHDPSYEIYGMRSAGEMLIHAYTLAKRENELPEMLFPSLEANPQSGVLRLTVASYYSSQNQHANAESTLREGLALTPKNRVLLTGLAKFLATCPDSEVRKPYEAVTIMEQLCRESSYEDPTLLCSLCGIYAAVNRFDEAVSLAERGFQLAKDKGDPTMVQTFNTLRLQLREALKSGRSHVTSPAF